MLPAPIIEGTLPAFYSEGNGTTANVVVPFSMSRAVNRDDVTGFNLKIKGLKGSNVLFTVSSSSVSYVTGQVIFSLNNEQIEKLSIGQFYKAQIAYTAENNEEGYYSTVGIIKYTTKPNVFINGLLSTKNNTHIYTYTGVYSQEEKDRTEKLYAYRFVIKNNVNEIIYDTDYLMHNSSGDSPSGNKATDNFTYSYDLTSNEKYTLTYMVKTNNGLEVSSSAYKIIQKELMDAGAIKKIFANVDDENGYVDIRFNVNPNPKNDLEKFEATLDRNTEQKVTGSFVLTRSTEDSQYKNWETIVQFSLYSQKPSEQSWRDFTVEHGKKYKYSIQQYSKVNQLYSNRIMTDALEIKFEHSFLFDGKRQLKIKFNPKVSSFKKNLAEAKIDTIGSKYPFIFKNGIVEYKEFPISGLISYFMDDEGLFSTKVPQLVKDERDFISIYHPFTWKTSMDPVTQTALRRTQYKEMYKYFYIKNETSNNYIRWVEYLDSLYGDTFTEEFLQYKNYDDYDKYFDENKTYYTRTLQNSNDTASILENIYTTNLTSSNISFEKEFKMEVLDWLTNGEIKLFRSPTEGNYIIRLMNVSLTPNDQLGRMLHTFQATAYEVDVCNYDTLKQYNFINTQGFKKSYFKIQSVPLYVEDLNSVLMSDIEYKQYAGNAFYFANGSLMPLIDKLEFIQLINIESQGSNITTFKINGEDIVIRKGDSLSLEMPIYSLSVENQRVTGVLNIGYYTDIDDTFNYISNIEIEEICSRQFTGPDDEIINKLKVQLFNNEGQENIPTEIVKEPFHYYLIRNTVIGENDTKIKITWNNGNFEEIDIENNSPYILNDLQNIATYEIGSGVICDITYSAQVKTYNINKGPNNLISAKNKLDIYNELLAYETISKFSNDLDNYAAILEIIYKKEHEEEEDSAPSYNGVAINKSYDVVYSEYLSKLEEYLQSVFEYNQLLEEVTGQ